MAEGLETSVTVNILSTVLLVLLMVPVMRCKAPLPHVVIVTSNLAIMRLEGLKYAQGDLLANLNDRSKADMVAR